MSNAMQTQSSSAMSESAVRQPQQRAVVPPVA